MRKHLFYLLLFFPFFGWAQDWSEISKITKEARSTYDYFGNQVAISGDYAVVGMMNLYSDSQEGESSSTRGAAHVYKWDGENWVFQQKLVASDAAQDDYFGYSGKGGGIADEKVVAIDGEYIVVSAYMEDEDENGVNTVEGAGSAYVFKLEGNTWVEKQKIVASDRAQYASFGSSIALQNESLVIGAKGSNTTYVFALENQNWTEKQKISMPLDEDGIYSSEFGKSTAIDGNQLLIGANQTDLNEMIIGSGVVYVYQKNGETWEIQQTLSAPTRFSNAYFGCSVSVSGDYIVVGAFYEDEQGVESFGPGAAYIFKKNGSNWEFNKKIVAWDGRAVSDQFGISVAIDGENLLVGAWGEDEDENGENTLDWAGSAYLFKLEEGNWIPNQKIVASDRSLSSSFGGSVALDGNRFIIGAESEFEGEFLYAAGSTYIFQKDCPILTPEVNPIESICSGESTSITITSDSESINWYDAADAETPIFTGTTFETPILTETTSFWVTISTEYCVSELTEVIVNVNPLPVLTIDETEIGICSGNEATLYAESPNNVIFWYANEDDTEYLYHGNLFVTEVLTENTTYWVEAYNLSTGCRSERIEVAITVGEALSAPIADDVQNFVAGMTLADFIVEHTGTLTWYADEALTQELPETTLVVAGTTYYVTQSGVGCESAATAVMADTFLGNGNLDQDKFAYYPNPVKDVLNFKGNEVVKSVQIYDLSGKLILNQNSNSISNINLSTLPKGTYVVKATTDKGMNTFKIVKN